MAGNVDCPSCGHLVRLPEGLAGLLVQCSRCGLTFMASAGRRSPPPAPLDDEEPPPRRSAPPADDWRRPLRRTEPGPGTRPCARCGEPLYPGSSRCPSCDTWAGEEEDEGRPWRDRPVNPVRRDCEPHRGRLIVVLGTVSVICGALALCTAGVGSLPGLGCGIPAWLLGNADLDKMRKGVMDPDGIGNTKNGRDLGIAGTVLSSITGIAMLLLHASRLLLGFNL